MAPKSMRPSVVLVQGGKILGGKETHLQDPDLKKRNIQNIEWINIKDLSKIRFYQREIVPLLKKDLEREGFMCKENTFSEVLVLDQIKSP